jgi:sulfotransferase
MVGFAISALRQAVFSDHADRLLLVRFDTLTRDPNGALAAIYDFIGQPRFAHDVEAVEQDYDALMFDARIGAPGLHHVRRRVRQVARRSLLPPDLFERHQAEAFWETAGGLPPAVRMI